LKIETKDLEDRQVQLTVEIPGEDVQKAMRSTAKRMSNQMDIAGFRRGKAPYQVVVNRIGEEAIFDEALDQIGQDAYRKALEESEIEPYAPGYLNEIVSRDPLVLQYTVPLRPEVDLGDYQEMRIPYEEAQIEDEELEEALEDLRQSRALVEPIDRPAEPSDVVVLKMRIELENPQEDEEALLLEQEEQEVLIDEEQQWPIPGVTEHLISLEPGDERTFKLTFPEDHPNESLQDRLAIFEIECLEVKSRLIPEWTDDLARSLGDFEDLLDLRLKLRENMQERARQQADADYAKEVVDHVVENAEISYPPILLQDEIRSLIIDLERQLARQNLSLEDYLDIEGKTVESLEREFEPRATDRLKRALVLGKIVDLEEIETAEEQVDAEIDRMVEPFQDQKEEIRKAFNTPQGRRRIELDQLTEKAIGRLVAIARGDAELEPKELEEHKDLHGEELAETDVSPSEEQIKTS
jgi:trigger factor